MYVKFLSVFCIPSKVTYNDYDVINSYSFISDFWLHSLSISDLFSEVFSHFLILTFLRTISVSSCEVQAV